MANWQLFRWFVAQQSAWFKLGIFHCTTIIKEFPAISQNWMKDLRYYGNFCIEEHEKIVKFLSRMIEEGHLERDVNSNLIRTLLKTFIDSNFTTHEESFAEVFVDHLT